MIRWFVCWIRRGAGGINRLLLDRLWIRDVHGAIFWGISQVLLGKPPEIEAGINKLCFNDWGVFETFMFKKPFY